MIIIRHRNLELHITFHSMSIPNKRIVMCYLIHYNYKWICWNHAFVSLDVQTMLTRCLYGSKPEIIDLHISLISLLSVKLEEETRELTKEQKKQQPKVKLLQYIKYNFIQELNSTFAVIWTHSKVNTDLTMIRSPPLEFLNFIEFILQQ